MCHQLDNVSARDVVTVGEEGNYRVECVGCLNEHQGTLEGEIVQLSAALPVGRQEVLYALDPIVAYDFLVLAISNHGMYHIVQ